MLASNQEVEFEGQWNIRGEDTGCDRYVQCAMGMWRKGSLLWGHNEERAGLSRKDSQGSVSCVAMMARRLSCEQRYVRDDAGKVLEFYFQIEFSNFAKSHC